MRPPNRAIVLLQLGGPNDPQSIEPFLRNLFSDPDTIPLPFWLKPLQPQLARLMARGRAPRVAKLYDQIGGSSPLLQNTTAQAFALEREMAGRGARMPVKIAMRCWHPFTEETMANLLAMGIEEVAVLPLYPQESQATTGSGWARMLAVVKNLRAPMALAFVRSYADHPGYIEASCDTIRQSLALFDQPGETCLVFAAHSLPMAMVEAGDPYPGQIKNSMGLILQLLDHPGHTRLAYQSQTGHIRWLGPTVRETLGALAARGIKNLILVPLGFVSEHLETLYEMDILYGDLARSLGMRFERSRALGTHPAFIKALGDLALAAFPRVSHSFSIN